MVASMPRRQAGNTIYGIRRLPLPAGEAVSAPIGTPSRTSSPQIPQALILVRSQADRPDTRLQDTRPFP